MFGIIGKTCLTPAMGIRHQTPNSLQTPTLLQTRKLLQTRTLL
ncbi:hypothetical protein SAMN06265222_101538 [Neorhodopirellula lusitana]|uniref:Uncharacterized protein n=1 Tax=Neorhodopirellula lusitana TaxID=445327 RepID=A0ABY1PQH3_9BACT|nr:hypothetical protein SAMN06265222_101538 [Neorhodopirellula lusitana]